LHHEGGEFDLLKSIESIDTKDFGRRGMLAQKCLLPRKLWGQNTRRL